MQLSGFRYEILPQRTGILHVVDDVLEESANGGTSLVALYPDIHGRKCECVGVR